MKPKFANSKSLYRIAVAGGIYHPDLVFTTKEDAQKFAASKLTSDNIAYIEPVNIVIGLEEDEVDQLMAEKKTLEAKLTEINKKLKNNAQSQTADFGDFIRAFVMR